MSIKTVLEKIEKFLEQEKWREQPVFLRVLYGDQKAGVDYPRDSDRECERKKEFLKKIQAGFLF